MPEDRKKPDGPAAGLRPRSVKAAAPETNKRKTEGVAKRRGKRRKEAREEVVEVACILDEKGKPNRQKKRGKRTSKHQFLCAWVDGGEPQWVDAVHLEGSELVERWEEAEDEEPEVRDDDSVVAQKCRELAEWLEEAKRPVFLLGAGISAPILPTFRGKNGLWTKNAHKNSKADAKVSDGLQPTLAHRALAALEREGKVYWVATQNYDDLSHRSGYPQSKLSELHGNIFTETCDDCHRLYHRDFEVPLDDSVNHETGRNCEDCGGILRDSVVHFGEDLPWHDLKMANAKFAGADLAVVLGSSVQVEPAASLPFRKRKKRKVIVNLQETGRDDEADLLIHATCDEVLDKVAKVLIGESWDGTGTNETEKNESE